MTRLPGFLASNLQIRVEKRDNKGRREQKTMFSTLGSIFTEKPRQAENTDTRQGIRRQDPDQEGRKKKRGHKEEPEFFGTEDDTSVSIDALRVFLVNFLKSLQKETETPNATMPETVQKDVLESGKPEQEKPRTGPLAQAAGVYAQTAQASEKQSLSIKHNPEADIHDGLEATEVRTIHRLLDDLQELSDRNIEYLVIERSTSFLQSLHDAVEKTKRT